MKYIIYHQIKDGVDCPDGIMAATIASLAMPDAHIIGDWYNSDNNFDFEGDEVTIVDFSYPAERLKEWEDLGAKMTVIDHHAPKFPELSGFSNAILDENECGATLAWDYFFPGQPRPPILFHVRRRDIGADSYYKDANACLDSKAITAALSHNRQEASNPMAYLQSVLELDDLSELRAQGKKIAADDERDAQLIAQRAYKICLPHPAGDGKVACWKVELRSEKEDRLVSLIGAAVTRSKGEGSICWIEPSDGSNSLRSNGVDISGYAKQLGGGGHPFASGFPRLEGI